MNALYLWLVGIFLAGKCGIEQSYRHEQIVSRNSGLMGIVMERFQKGVKNLNYTEAGIIIKFL